MINKNMILFSILFVGLLAVSAVSAADNATYDIVSVKKTAVNAMSIENDNLITVSANNESENVNSDNLLSDLADEDEDEDDFDEDEDSELYVDVRFPLEVSSGKGTFGYVYVLNLPKNNENSVLTLFVDDIKINQEVSLIEDEDEGIICLIKFDSSGLDKGTHRWNVTCVDISKSINYSESGSFDVVMAPDTMEFALINRSLIYIPFDKINWNIKTITVYDEYVSRYYGSPYIDYKFSTFTLNDITYTIISSSIFPTLFTLSVKFNPNDYKEYDKIYYKLNNGEISDVIGFGDYGVYDNEFYRRVGAGFGVFSGDIGNVDYCIVNGECYKITGTMGASTAILNKAIPNVDYKIVNGKFYTLNGTVIKNLVDESFGNHTVINGTFYEIDNNVYRPHSVWTIGYSLINNNGKLSRLLTGTDYTNSYTVIDGKLYSVVDDKVGNVIELDYSKIIASNVKVTYSAGSYYTVKVYGPDGKLADNVKVVITVNGKTFKTLTTKNGAAKFKVTNAPGTYKMSITSLGHSISKTLTVKHLVTLKSVAVKKSAKKLTLTASLAKVNAKYLKNKKITFKFNGKKYTAKTNSKGVAKVTIKSSVLKKLKVGKKVTYQATYGKDTVKKTVKINK